MTTKNEPAKTLLEATFGPRPMSDLERVAEETAAGEKQRPAPAPRGLFAKLAEAMAEVGRVPKRGRNQHFGYDYATEADVMETVRTALAKRGVMLLPTVGELHDISPALLRVRLDLTFVDSATGETHSSQWYGIGEDKGDRGDKDKKLYKAYTGAMKYALLKTFLMSTGDDPEEDGDAKPAPKRQAAPKAAVHNFPPDHGQAVTAPPPAPAGPRQGRPLYQFLQAEAARRKIAPDVFRELLKTSTGKASINALTPDDEARALAAMEAEAALSKP